MKSSSLKVKSLYIPSEALQGQEIPLHVIWDGTEWDEVWLRVSRRLRFEDVFNVKKWAEGRRVLKLRRSALKVPGYIGAVLKSSIARHESQYTSLVRVSFRRNGKSVFSKDADIALFRPEMKLLEVPDKIEISEHGKVKGRISLEVSGMGTLLLFVEAAPHSSVRVRLPDEVKLAFQEFAERLLEGFEIAEKEFPEYSDFFDRLLSLDPSEGRELVRMQREIQDQILSSRELQSIIQRVFIVAYSRTTRIQTAVTKPILEISRSTLAAGVLLLNPFMELKIPEKRSNSRFMITGQNVLRRTITKIRTPEIPINVEGEIPSLPVSSMLRIQTSGRERRGN